MSRCLGITNNLRRCGRQPTGRLFCDDHRKQPIAWVFFIVFTCVSGAASIYSVIQSEMKTYEDLVEAINNTKTNSNSYFDTFDQILDMAKLGDPRAQNLIGVLFKSSTSPIGQNPIEARTWLLKAAQQGHAKAQYNLASMYARGELGEPDYEQAYSWYSAAASQSDADAFLDLGIMYQYGEGRPADRQEAEGWYRKAANAGIPKAAHLLGVLLERGEEAKYWAMKAAEAGYSPAIHSMGVLLLHDEERNPKEAMKWFERGAAAGETGSMVNLGFRYLKGDGTKKNATKALKWFEKASATGDEKGALEAGVLYFKGEDNIEQNFTKAKKYLHLAAERGSAIAASAVTHSNDSVFR